MALKRDQSLEFAPAGVTKGRSLEESLGAGGGDEMNTQPERRRVLQEAHAKAADTEDDECFSVQTPTVL